MLTLVIDSGRTTEMDDGRYGPNWRRAEEAVANWLTDQGVLVEERNLRLGHLELDIVGRLGDVILIVEVRLRGPGAYTSGLSSIGFEKRRRLRFAGERLWRKRYRFDDRVHRLRFDVASVTETLTGFVIEYVEAAF